ncbi:MAG TPA: HAMP domain-containing sensor histidine kinase [Acidimicrobiales bacterium]|nr:HAMP domain-containing sensor histidine kinase [Acidimicrobiales bacterium]
MSLRSRLVLAVAAVALVALVAADFATYSALRSSLYNRVDQSLQQSATSLPLAAGGVPPAGRPGENPTENPGEGQPGAVGQEGMAGTGQGNQAPPAAQADAPGAYLEVRNAAGRTILGPFAGHLQGGKAYSPTLPAHFTGFTPAPGTGVPQLFLTEPSTAAGGPDFRVLVVRRPGGGVLILGMPLADTASTLDQLVVIEVVVTGAALAAAVLLGLWLVRVGLRPLADVEDTAERIAGGELDQRVPGENDRTEVGRLALTVNVMLTRIEEAFAQRDATEAELRLSEERLRQFVADASHELRTPLAAVSAYAELFERGARERPDDLDRVMTGIRGESARMSRLVEDLLLLARLDEGRPLERQPVDVAAVATDAVQTAATVGPGWPVTLDVGPMHVLGDQAALRQVLDNLLANVRAHTPEGTVTTVRVTRRGPDAVVEVADRGPGMTEDQAAHAFERFYRADPSRSRAHGGAGLGLSIVAAIVAAHGGRVTAAARPGGGTTMTVVLPAVPDPPPV